MSKEEIDNHIEKQLGLRGNFDWSYVSDEVLYSAAMHSESVLYLTYSPNPNANSGSLPMSDENYKKTGKLPQEWIKVRDKIIQYILEKERIYKKQPDLTKSQILYPLGREPDETLACITIIFSAPSLIPGLRKNEFVKSVEPGYTTMKFLFQE